MRAAQRKETIDGKRAKEIKSTVLIQRATERKATNEM